jgi:hypothetical protein
VIFLREEVHSGIEISTARTLASNYLSAGRAKSNDGSSREEIRHITIIERVQDMQVLYPHSHMSIPVKYH